MGQTSRWTSVTSQLDVNQLLEITMGFHDSVTTVVSWKGNAFISTNGALGQDGYGSLFLGVGSQYPGVPDIVARIRGVKSFEYRYESEPLDPTLKLLPQGIHLEFGPWRATREALQYRIFAQTRPGPHFALDDEW